MGRKELLAVLCWLTLSYGTAKAAKTASGAGVIDNVSDESVSRLYHEVPVGVYASANPYAAYSFHVPQFVVPKSKQIVPVKEESIVAQSTNGFLKDSYGQTFVESPQSFSYKATFPQQFVPLQNLPAHLSQPLVAAAPNTQYGRITPHFFGPAPFKFGNLHAFATNPVNQFPQSFIFADNVKTLTAAPALNRQVNDLPVAQSQPSSNKNVYANTVASEQYNKFTNEPKFQRIQEGPKLSFAASDQQEKQQQRIQKLPLISGHGHENKIVANLVTKPPVPLLDLTLLEPLTFDNPLVPQVQHFLPRIHQVVYKKLPEVNQVKKHEMVFMVQNTKSYDSDLLEDKPKNNSPKKKQKKRPPKKEDDDDIEVKQTPNVVTVQETLDENPEISYEVNSPNYKESFSKKKISFKKETESEPVIISYEKKTESEPVHYSYEKRTDKKPVTYSYAHNSKQPAQIKQAYNNNNNNNLNPKHLIYHFNPETQQRKENIEPQHHIRPQSESEGPSDEPLNEKELEYDTHQKQQQQQHPHNNARHELDEEVPANNDQTNNQEINYHHSKEEKPEIREEAAKSNDYKPQTQPEHREVYYQNNKGSSENQEPLKPIAHPPVQHFKTQFEAIVPEYEEDITILPTHKPHAPAHVEQHHNRNLNERHRSQPEQQNKDIDYNYRESDYSSNPNEQEKSKREKDESPQEIYRPNEEITGPVVKKEEDSEEDFEKAYKDAAYGFPAYNAPYRDVEKEIYNPESYGASRYIYDYDAQKSPLRHYQAEGDEYPTQTRSQYKDARDKTNEEYFLDYALSRPKSLTDRYNKKADYYKIYEEHRPENYFAKKDDDKKQQNAKYTAAPVTYGYHIIPQQKQQFAKYRAAPKSETPHDNSAFATRPHHRFKSKTQFVEPQYQYGFEPLTIPQLLDSELAAMASNISPEKENLGMRKNLFKEKYYIKKTVTSRGGKDS